MSYTEKIARRAGGLEPDERLLAACKAMVADEVVATILFTAGSVVGGAAGAMASTRITPGDGAAGQAAAAADLATAPQMILGLSDRRLIAWRMSGFLARPREVLGFVDRARIVTARLVESKLFGFRVGRILIDLHDTPHPLDFSVPRVQIAEATALVAMVTGSPMAAK